jgi:hypothetical protein
MNIEDIHQFLVIYDVRARQASVEQFDDYDDALAAYERIEKEHFGRDDLDIVLLGADSLETIKKTHSSYFETAEGGFEKFFKEILQSA